MVFLKSNHWFFAFAALYLLLFFLNHAVTVLMERYGFNNSVQAYLRPLLFYSFALVCASAAILKKIGVDFIKTSEDWSANFRKDVLLGLAYFGFFLLLMCFLCGIGYPWRLPQSASQEMMVRIVCGNPLVSLIFLGSLCVIVPLGEEIFFKRLLYVGVRQEMRVLKSIALCSLLFSLIHPKSGLLPILLFSPITYYMYEKHKRLFANIVLHSLINFTAVLSSVFNFF